MTFHATTSTVEIQDDTGAVILVPTLMFYDAIPGAPDRGTARIDGMERECAIVEWDQYSALQDELVTLRDFVPIEWYINEYAEQNDLEMALQAVKSFNFFNYITETR